MGSKPWSFAENDLILGVLGVLLGLAGLVLRRPRASRCPADATEGLED
jgi:hypothetical protein